MGREDFFPAFLGLHRLIKLSSTKQNAVLFCAPILEAFVAPFCRYSVVITFLPHDLVASQPCRSHSIL